MYDFKHVLLQDEEIKWQGESVPGKGSISILGEMVWIFFILLCQVIVVLSVIFKTGDGALGFSSKFYTFMFVLLIFDAVAIYSIIYKKFLKKRIVKNNYYCLTNKRVIKYNDNTTELSYGYLINYSEIHIVNQKDGYGDVFFGVRVRNEDDKKSVRNLFLKQHLGNDERNKKSICFACIEHPTKISKLAKDLRKDLKDNGDNPTEYWIAK